MRRVVGAIVGRLVGTPYESPGVTGTFSNSNSPPQTRVMCVVCAAAAALPRTITSACVASKPSARSFPDADAVPD